MIKIYPVPSTGEISIEGMDNNYSLNVVDMTGRFVISNEAVMAHKKKTIYLPQGMYSILLTDAVSHIMYHRTVSVIR
jgi:hypothetical protein